MEPLTKIFGSSRRVKVMRLFLFNEETPFDIDDLAERTRSKKTEVRKEVTMLVRIGFLKKKTFTKSVPKKTRSKKITQAQFRKVKKHGWILNETFELLRPLKSLLLESELVDEQQVKQRVKKLGSVKLLILSGVFVGDDNRFVDVLVVGNKLNPSSLNREISIIESEGGRELAYAFFDQKEFEYRMGMYDKLVRDVLENDHRKLINTILS